jgi:putative phosphoesterase
LLQYESWTPRTIVTRYAIISDIHGNRWALETVLNDLKDRGIEKIINLGDSVYGPLDPAATAEMLMQQKIISVLGNEDRVILCPGDTEPSPTLQYVLENLEKKHIEWLRDIPANRIVDGSMFACHASPHSDIEYFFWDVRGDHMIITRRDDMETWARNNDYPVLLCGHDHTPRSTRLQTGTFIVNPGSVGLPAFKDDIPYHHIMQAGSPHTRYAIVSENNGEWNAEQIALEYDWEAAATIAAQNGRQDWSSWLRTGKTVVD